MEKTAFICDDDPVVQMILTAILNSMEYEVTTVSSGKECLEAFSSGTLNPGVIFLDVQLGDTTGPEVLDRLDESLGSRRPPVILLSANPEAEMNTFITRVHPEAYLEKPFTAAKVKDALQSLNKNA